MITDEQKERRKNGIFASDVAQIMTGHGVEVALEKMGRRTPPDLDGILEVDIGTEVESLILDAYEKIENEPTERSPDTMWHPEHSWLGAHLDAVTLTRNVEVKSVGKWMRSEWGDGGDQVPDKVLWQVQAQCAVSGLTEAHVAVLFVDEQSLKYIVAKRIPPISIYTIPADKELERILIERCKKVWDCVQTGTLPAPEKVGDLELIYSRDNGTLVEATDEIFEQWENLLVAKANEKIAKDAVEQINQVIKGFMLEASALVRGNQTLATWKKNTDKWKLDKDRLSAEHPEIYEQYLIPKIGSRVLLIKDPSKKKKGK